MAVSLDGLDANLRAAALALDGVVRDNGRVGKFTSTVRSRAEQSRLYRRFLAGLSQFPALPPGQSAHEYGLAFDYIVEPLSADTQQQLGEIWQSWGGGWSPTDAVHFELPGASDFALAAARAIAGPQSILSRGSEALAYAADFYFGSNVAGLMRLIPGLSQNQALQLLSQPFETFQKLILSFG
jgi:hypothetical protein